MSACEAFLRRAIAERDVDGILRALLDAAIGVVGADEGTAYCWNASAGELQPVGGRMTAAVRPGDGIVGKAVTARRTTIVGDEIGVPLPRGDDLIGALWVRGTRAATERARIEELAALAVQVVSWFEAVRLDGALLAARTAEHEVNNRLVATTAYAQLMLRDPTFPTHLRERAESIAKGAKEAAVIVRKLRELADIQETRWGPDPELTTIDLSASRSREP